MNAIVRMRVKALLAAVGMLTLSAPAHAELPAPVRAMIDAAIATGDEAKVRTVAEIARDTYPADGDEITAILATFEAEMAERRLAKAKAKEAAIRTAGLFDYWKGKGELGGFRATGNTTGTGITTSLAAERTGIDWRHKLTGRVDFQRANGVTTREQFLGRYEPNFNLSERFYIYALAQYERDRFQGFSGRYAISGGLGYEALNKDNIQLSIKAGPAYRVTEFVDGRNESRVAGLVGVAFEWDITDRLKLTQDTNAVAETGGAAIAIIDSRNTSIDVITGLNARINSSLSARFSYAIEYNSTPPPGAVQTDSLSRMTLVYDF